MNERERELLNDIHSDLRETHTQITEVDERTKNIQSNIENLRNDVDTNTKDIDTLQDNVQRNKTILTGIGTIASAVVLWAADKLSRFF